jgi:4-hydroxybenzoate polyprenyltransferase/phosphoserine phosphatase
MTVEAALAPVLEQDVPLVVDVDGTLVATDLLHEAALHFAAHRPWEALRLPLWLAEGKARFKERLADAADPGIDSVPLRPEVLALIREAQEQGRPVYLASASDRRYIEALARRVGGIDGVFATDGAVNLAGANKADQLVRAFGRGGYDYVGDMPVDFPVWEAARKPLVVARSAAFANRVQAAFPAAEIVARPRPALRSYIRAVRPHQWVKNILLFLPMLAGHRFGADTLLPTALGFVCFCMAASSAYLLNDLLDLQGDRDHPRKRYRPFAAGAIPVLHGVALSALLMAGAFLLSLPLPLRFTEILGLYVLGTLSYSLVLKRKVLIDVVVLSGLYTIRVYGGLSAVDVQQTPWLMMFSLFLFLSLAFVKRCSELIAYGAQGRTDLVGRSYRTGDLSVLLPLGAAAGYGAVFVVALYASSPDVMELYYHPHRLWLICPLLIYWISRVLVLCNRGELHDDPVIFAMRDKVSWALGVCVAAIVLAAA